MILQRLLAIFKIWLWIEQTAISVVNNSDEETAISVVNNSDEETAISTYLSLTCIR